MSPPRFAAGDSEELAARAERHGNRLLWPVLLVPVVAVAGGATIGRIAWSDGVLVEAGSAPQVALALGCLAGLALAFAVTRERAAAAINEGGRLLQLIGWTLVLPQALAALGGILAKAGVGEEVARVVAALLPVENPLVAVLAYCAGMALLTVLTGNAFAAFPVITLGIGIPFIVEAHRGDRAILGTLGMLSGYCGTLLTPMAANFNIVPVRLLELPNDHAVIRAQAPYAAAIWVFNAALMYACVYPS